MAGSRSVRATKEAFHVRVEASDGSVAFYNATEYVGRTMPFAKPRATCAMRVGPDAVSFSLLHLTNKNASLIAGKPVTIPRGPLSRLERRAVSYAPLSVEQLIIEISSRPPGNGGNDTEDSLDDLFAAAEAHAPTPTPTPAPALAAVDALDDLFSALAETPNEADPGGADLGDLFSASDAADALNEADSTSAAAKPVAEYKKSPMRPAVIETFRCILKRDSNGVAHIEAEGDEHIFELPRGALHISLYLASPVAAVKRTLAVGFIGHVGKPGSMETVSRVSAMVLNSISHLPDFRILSQIETVAVPANPTRGLRPSAAGRRSDDRVQFAVKVFLFDDALEPCGVGLVGCEIDLENANPTTGKLLINYTAEDVIAGAFDRYRSVFDTAVAQHLRVQLGEEALSEIVYDVVLGSVSASTVATLRQIGKSTQALDLTPAQFREHA